MKAVIIEDEPIAVERLRVLIEQVCPDTIIEACLDSVSDAVDWFSSKPQPDIILMDIQLSDGSAFDIFRKVRIEKPVIFITAYDQYALDAFSVLSIDYLLKPISADCLQKAFNKMKMFLGNNSTALNYQELLSMMQVERKAYKSRFLARIGNRCFFVAASEIAYCTADDKIVYLVTLDGSRYVVDYTLEALEQILNPVDFFRINRSMIINCSAIQQIKPFLNGRLKLALKTGNIPGEFLVSRERVNSFKTWAEQ